MSITSDPLASGSAKATLLGAEASRSARIGVSASSSRRLQLGFGWDSRGPPSFPRQGPSVFFSQLLVSRRCAILGVGSARGMRQS